MQEVYNDIPACITAELFLEEGAKVRFQASNLGHVRKISGEKISYPAVRGDRYLVDLWYNNNRKTVQLSRLVWSAFNGEIPEGYVIHHRDFDHNNNKLSNLQMLTEQEHARIHGNYNKPVVCYDLSGSIVAEYGTIYQAAKAIGKPTSTSHISDCCHGKARTSYGYKWKFKNND